MDLLVLGPVKIMMINMMMIKISSSMMMEDYSWRGIAGEVVHHIDVSAKVAVRQDLSVNSDLLNKTQAKKLSKGNSFVLNKSQARPLSKLGSF